MSSFMSQYLRAQIQGGCYFFTVVTYQRRHIFTTEAHVELLRQACRRTMLKRPFTIDAMVILPNHLHCIWQLPSGAADYSSRWRDIKKAVSQHINHSTNTRNERPVWQRRFWEHTIRDEKDWRQHMDYIHYNPVKHGLATSPAAWPWSSFHHAVNRGWYDPAWGSSEPQHIANLLWE